MNLGARLDKIHLSARRNKWLSYFAIFCRIVLAFGFIPPGLQKILGERFTVLSVNHPMGNFLEAFFHTGYYYPFVGFLQVLAGVLLLIPRTVTLGAIIYLPIILNICILSFSVRFDGSMLTSPLMVCAVLYLLCWDYHKFRNIFPYNYRQSRAILPQPSDMNNKFPWKFFAAVLAVVIMAFAHPFVLYEILPRNTLSDCRTQCSGEDVSCMEFCSCIHMEGKPLRECLDMYNN